jgi:hypothetical protein
MFGKLDPTELEIFKLKEKIEEQRVMIEQRRALK